MKNILVVGIILLFTGCTVQKNYISPTLEKNSYVQIFIDDFIEIIKDKYMPTSTNFSISSKNNTEYKSMMLNRLLHDGYSICLKKDENACPNTLEIVSIIDIIDEETVRSSFYVDNLVISRIYIMNKNKKLEQASAVSIYRKDI